MRKTESFLQCVRCSRTYDIGQLRYTCDCGGVLDVKRDLSKIDGGSSRRSGKKDGA